MARLDSLIRFHKHDLDEKRKQLGLLNAKATEIEETLKALEEEREKEAEFSSQNPNLGSAYTNYLIGYKQTKKQLNQMREDLEEQINDAMFEIQEKFTELKKYEVLHEKRLQEIAKKRQKQEDQTFDEIGLQLHDRRNKKEE